MARIRTIKPEFWTDSKTGTLSSDAKCLFLGMLNHADDNGVLGNDCEELRVKVFPYSKPDLKKVLSELIERALIKEFERDGKAYLWIRNFGRHQNINRPSNPIIPDFNPAELLSDDSVSTHVVGSEDSMSVQGVFTEYSLREGKEGRKEGNGMEGNGREGKGRAALIQAAFDALWRQYPSKVGKIIARSAFFATLRGVEGDQLLFRLHEAENALRNYLKSSRVVQKNMIQDGKRWFREWTDWVEHTEDVVSEDLGAATRRL